MQLVHKNHPRKAHKENPTTLHEADTLCCFVLERDVSNCEWWSRGGMVTCRHAGELLPPDGAELHGGRRTVGNNSIKVPVLPQHSVSRLVFVD